MPFNVIIENIAQRERTAPKIRKNCLGIETGVYEAQIG